MPVTHGVRGSSPLHTALSVTVMVKLNKYVYYAFSDFLSSLDALRFPQQIIDIVDDAECFLASIDLSSLSSTDLALWSKECASLSYDVDVLLDYIKYFIKGSIPIVDKGASMFILHEISHFYDMLFSED